VSEVTPNNSMQRTALRAAADAGRWTVKIAFRTEELIVIPVAPIGEKEKVL
jgi:hypothetical protein